MDTTMTMTSFTKDSLTAQDVLTWLQQNPDFLASHPELISTLPEEVRKAGDNIVDFQQLMVQKLRTDKQRAEDRQRLLVDSARNNLTVQARVHAGVVRMLEAETLDEFVEMVGSELALILEVDVISISLEATHEKDSNTIYQGIRIVNPGFINNQLGPDRDALLQANLIGDPRLFGPAARLVKSQALMRLNIARHIPDGILAFGSRDPLLFADGQGTDLVSFLTDVIERILRRFLAHGA